MIPYGRQYISDEDVNVVVSVLRSDWLTQGPFVLDFEQSVASKVGAKFAVALNSATSALHIACLALGLKEGDWVWTSPNTFVASANCAYYCNAQVDFVDIDPFTFNMSVECLEIKLKIAEQEGKLPKILIPVHFGGQSCDMKSIHMLAKKYGFSVIEDASHAIGGMYENSYIGNCMYSDISIFSFHPVKIITTGEGGMAVTNNEQLAKRIALLRSHGITRDPSVMVEIPHGDWYYEQLELGFNYRMTDIQAALGCSQLLKLDDFIESRQNLAKTYDLCFKKLSISTQKINSVVKSAYHLYVIRVDSSYRAGLFHNLRSKGIGVNVHYMPVYLQPYYQKRGFVPGYCPEAEAYYREAISIPMYAALDSRAQHEVIEAISGFIEKYTESLA